MLLMHNFSKLFKESEYIFSCRSGGIVSFSQYHKNDNFKMIKGMRDVVFKKKIKLEMQLNSWDWYSENHSIVVLRRKL